LELAHQKLYAILGQKMSEALSYFEYTTLLALVAFEQVDLIVLEAGLGGEFDATNVCDKELSIITPIGIDHQAFLGDTIEEIASTKIRSIQKQVLLAPQVYIEVLEVAKEIANDKKAILYQQEKIDKLVGWENPTTNKIVTIAKSNSWANYLIDNAHTALKALDILSISYNIQDLKTLKLFGRFYPLTDNIRIDVGHNPLAAQAIVEALNRPIVLIYNSLDDKDYEQVLQILKPKIKRVEILPIRNQRAVTTESIKEALEELEIDYSEFADSIIDNEEYLVFGSFYVVEEFLKSFELYN
jgi:dihydrofolate synthase/folylpolyglutamate synthase